MIVTRIEDARPYDAPGHTQMVALSLQGPDVSGCQGFNVGLSHFLPGGGAVLSASQKDRVYVVTRGEVTVVCGGEANRLSALDSCFIPAGEEREVINETSLPATMIVIVGGAENTASQLERE